MDRKLSTATLQTVSATLDNMGLRDTASSSLSLTLPTRSSMHIRNLLNDEAAEPLIPSSMDASAWFDDQPPMISSDHVPLPVVSPSPNLTSNPSFIEHAKPIPLIPPTDYQLKATSCTRPHPNPQRIHQLWTSAPTSLSRAHPATSSAYDDRRVGSADHEERFADPPTPPSTHSLSFQPSPISPSGRRRASQIPRSQINSLLVHEASDSPHRPSSRATLPPHLKRPPHSYASTTQDYHGPVDLRGPSPISPDHSLHHLPSSSRASSPQPRSRHLSLSNPREVPPANSRLPWVPSPLSHHRPSESSSCSGPASIEPWCSSSTIHAAHPTYFREPHQDTYSPWPTGVQISHPDDPYNRSRNTERDPVLPTQSSSSRHSTPQEHTYHLQGPLQNGPPFAYK